ncbi:putative ribonuclease H-like domain-containing protein [Tanacetum coccineum]
MDVKSAFLYSTIDEEVYVSQPPGFIDPDLPANIPSPTPIPETEPKPFEHIFEEPSPVHQPSSPPQEQAQG